MTRAGSPQGRHLLEGVVRVTLADALLPLTGLITAGFLTRRLGAADYGLFTLSATLIVWLEFSIASLFARGTIKLIGDAEDWRPVGALVVRLHVAAGLGVMILVWAVAGPLARLLGEPILATYLRLFALDLPVFALSQGHLQILVGLGYYRQRAVVTATRWLARLGLILLLVGLGWSVPGAIVASLGTSVVELLIGRYYIRPSLFSATVVPSRRLWDYAVPLFLSALSLRLFRLDQFALKALGGTAEQAGYYGAAQNLAYVPSLFGLALGPLLLSTLTRVLRDGDPGLAKALARDAMRLVLLALPLAALLAGASREIVQLIFGPQFAPTAPLFAWLVWPAMALTMISVTAAILTAAGHPRWTFALVGPLVPLAVAGQLGLVPRYGPTGAAAVTTVLAITGAIASVAAVGRLWNVLPPVRSLLRSAALGIFVYLLAAQWPTPGWWVVPKLAGLGAVTVLGYLALGEFNRREIDLARSLLANWRPRANPEAP